jgi:hypothetical protein
VNQAFLDYYRCPGCFADFRSGNGQDRNGKSGYFCFGPELICYGSVAQGRREVDAGLSDVSSQVRIEGSTCLLPFDPTEIANNFRWERYVTGNQKSAWKKLIRDGYYCLRPALPVSVRRPLQRTWLRGRDQVTFPRWPVDRTVDRMFEKLMFFSLEAHKKSEIPFIWFWPDGKSSCAMMTHDVETAAGMEFVGQLMDINDSFAIKGSFQIIPEERYAAGDIALSAIRSRGFEINIHDLKHDGHLFDDHNRFLQAAARINQYATRFGCRGFRSGVLYRNLNWYEAFSFSYDMSVPNNGRLDPQPGGCCTVMPYFVGKVLELPVTTTQDYALFNILGTYSLDLWREQISQIMRQHGLISFIVHPDYLNTEKATKTYSGLLAHLAALRSNEGLWIALPGQVDSWWRHRSQMKLVENKGNWRIEGPGAGRAKVAYATIVNNQVVYRIS